MDTIEQIFSNYKIQGTFYLLANDGKPIVYNPTRAELQFNPASTFKIPNTLIALEEGVTDLNEVFTWDGKEREFQAHNSDHTLKSAYQASCVWVYQELAKRIGRKSYLEHLERMQYGNANLGPNLQRFWLDGDLKISAVEQVHFLQRLYSKPLLYSENNISALKDIMLETETADYSLRTKTGYGLKPEIGWYVGVLKTTADCIFFAMNMDMSGLGDLPRRKELAIEILKSLNLLP